MIEPVIYDVHEAIGDMVPRGQAIDVDATLAVVREAIDSPGDGRWAHVGRTIESFKGHYSHVDIVLTLDDVAMGCIHVSVVRRGSYLSTIYRERYESGRCWWQTSTLTDAINDIYTVA